MPRIKPKWRWEGPNDGWETTFFPIFAETSASKFRRISRAKRRIRSALSSQRVSEESQIKIKRESKKIFRAVEQICRTYLFCRQESKTKPTMGQMLVAIEQAAALAEKEKILIGLDERTRDRVVEIVSGEDTFIPVSQCLKAFVEDVAIREMVVEEIRKNTIESNQPKRGAPKNETRLAFAVEIGRLLKNYGIELKLSYRRETETNDCKTGKGGVFFRVLDALFEMMGDKVLDLYPLLKAATLHLSGESDIHFECEI